jgi:transposase
MDLVAERTRALNRLHALLRDLLPGGVAGKLSAPRAARILRRHTPQGRLGPPQTALGLRGAARRSDAGPKDRRPQRAHRSRGGRLGHHPHLKIFGIGPILAARIIGTG